MKKPVKKDYCKAFSLDKSLMLFDSKKYARDAEAYIEYLEAQIKNLKKQKK